jgi:hypothetical protein
VDVTVCKICLVQFWSRERCLTHVRYRSVVRRANHVFRGPCITHEETNAVDTQACTENHNVCAVGRRRHFDPDDQPSMQTRGPPLPIISVRSSSHHTLGLDHNYS